MTTTMVDIGFWGDHRDLIHIRDGKYCPAFEIILEDGGGDARTIATTQFQCESIHGAVGTVGDGRLLVDVDPRR